MDGGAKGRVGKGVVTDEVEGWMEWGWMGREGMDEEGDRVDGRESTKRTADGQRENEWESEKEKKMLDVMGGENTGYLMRDQYALLSARYRTDTKPSHDSHPQWTDSLEVEFKWRLFVGWYSSFVTKHQYSRMYLSLSLRMERNKVQYA